MKPRFEPRVGLFRAGAITELVKRLPCKHGGPELEPCEKLGMVVHTCNPVWGGEDRWGPRSCWMAILPSLGSPEA